LTLTLFLVVWFDRRDYGGGEEGGEGGPVLAKSPWDSSRQMGIKSFYSCFYVKEIKSWAYMSLFNIDIRKNTLRLHQNGLDLGLYARDFYKKGRF